MMDASSLTRPYLKWIHYSATGAIVLPISSIVCTLFMFTKGEEPLKLMGYFALALLTWAVFRWLKIAINKAAPHIEAHADREVEYLDSIPQKLLPWAIVGSAALSLFAELVIIRWLATMWHVFAFYKNLTMLACFAGLGIGYSIANRRIPLVCTLPLLAFTTIIMTVLRYAVPLALTRSIWADPVPETFAMGMDPAKSVQEFFSLYLFMAVAVTLTALAFIPIGQLCGKLMERMENPLRAYGMNLLGSLLGVVLMTIASMLWTGPAIWFIVIAIFTIVFLAFNKQSIIIGGVASLIALGALCWPVDFGAERVYSPYQLIERVVGPAFVPMLFTGGSFYLTICDFRPEAVKAYPDRAALEKYYNLPFKLVPHAEDVAIVGAGSGNDVSAAIRGDAQHIDAVEIDPVIQRFGALMHPEQPFANPRVNPIINDARAFFRTTKKKYDLIVFSIIDSHTLTSHASSLRLDSYIYTTQALKDARACLKPNGIVCLSFCAMNPQIAKKIYLMMYDAFDKHEPVSVKNTSYTFLQNKNGDFKLPDTLLDREFYIDVKSELADPNLKAEASTDDWPFLYMPARIYPFSYFPMFGLVLLLSFGMIRSMHAIKMTPSSIPFFFLGAGFMLIETKAITELGLNFGNTWYVVGIVIAAIMIMAYLSNLLVLKTKFTNTTLAFILLLGSILLGWYIIGSGGYESSLLGKIGNVAVLTMPMLFSGAIFSALLNKHKDITSAMAFNLMGAMLGGLLEYNSMYFGYRTLYLFALAIYALAFITSISQKKAVAD